MAFIQISAPGDLFGTVTAALNLLTSASDTYRAAIQDQTPEGRATLRFFVELMAPALAIVTKINGGLKIDPLSPPKPGIAGRVEEDPAELARAALAQLLESSSAGESREGE